MRGTIKAYTGQVFREEMARAPEIKRWVNIISLIITEAIVAVSDHTSLLIDAQIESDISAQPLLIYVGSGILNKSIHILTPPGLLLENNRVYLEPFTIIRSVLRHVGSLTPP